jgi:predicted PurR-regulated permease PerM
MLVERGAFAEKLPRLCANPEDAARLRATLRSISDSVQQYMWINTVTSAISGVLAYIVLKLVGVDFAAFLALIVFLLNFIPNIGSVLAVLFPTLVAILQFDTVTSAVIMAVVYGSGDAIIGNVVQPAMQGKSLNLSTIMVMIALTFWGAMWGGVGAFMAVPLTMVTMIVCAEIPALRSVAILLSSDGVLPGENASDAPDET